MVLSEPTRRLAALLAVATALTACAKVPFDAPRTPSYALPADASSDAVSRAVSTQTGAQSAYFELANGTDALGARLRMIESAQHSIDIATFLIKPDTASSILTHRLFDAANRGVRVRLLVDDVFTTADDTDLAVLDTHPNIEIRIFNPSSRNAPKAMGFLWDFKRVNRRMHIKTFVVDNDMATIGGRNFADEYYELKPTEVFADYDLAVFGPEAAEINPIFDTYWNDAYAIPVANLRAKSAPKPPQIALSDWAYDPDSPEVAAYTKAINARYLQDIANRKVAPFRGTSVLVGSLNLDPRSIKTNAEIGLLVDSPAYARSILTNLDKNLADFAYNVTAEDAGLQWTHKPKTVAPTVVTKDPDAGLWRRFMSVLPQWFGLEGLT